MSDWLEQLSVRERRALALGGISLLVLAAVFLVWRPVVVERARLAAEVQEEQETLNWMRGAAQEIRVLQTARRTDGAGDQRSLIARVTAQLQSARLSPTQVKPEGEQRLRVILEDVAFTRLLVPLNELHNLYGALVSEVIIEPATNPGRVNARILFERKPAK
ncbi:MAG: type II secretion system protein M [Pseudomonadota bacterium]